MTGFPTLSSRTLCSVSILAVIIMMAVEGTWGIPMHRNPLMWAASIVMMLSLVSTILDSIRIKSSAPSRLYGILCHMGLFLILFGTLLGARCIADVQMTVSSDHADSVAYARNGQTVQLPFSIRLVKFETDYYDDGVSPEQYSCTLEIDGEELCTSVNHPCRYKGYRIYQSDFDRYGGTYSVLKLVRDPWLPVIFLGMILLAAGTILGLSFQWRGKRSSYVGIIAVLALAVIFAIVSVARIKFGTLVPALRSLWFIPHLVLYMLAYSSLALALIAGIVFYIKKNNSAIPGRLFNTASALLLLGMLCGAVWAKAAWGDWWNWDAKECWAAATWFFTILGTHLPDRIRKHDAAVLLCIFLAFAAMQMAWYGVDYLPASFQSLHTYR